MNLYRFRIGQSTIKVITVIATTTITRINGTRIKSRRQTTPQNIPQNKRKPTGTVNQPANKTMRLNNIEEDHFLGQNPE